MSFGPFARSGYWFIVMRAAITPAWVFSKNWTSVGVGTGAGTYHEGNSEKDLGYDVEFYSRITLAYRLAKAGQIRAELGHLSNADLSSVNPGTELFSINWVFEFY